MAKKKSKQKTAEANAWLFIEDNEWEGERWKVYFRAPAELTAQLEALQEFVNGDEDGPYELRSVSKIPKKLDDGRPQECEYAEDYEGDEEDGDEADEEGCGDCDYCCGSEGYYPAESELELKVEVLTEALDYYDHGDPDRDQDPLYKLGLFG